MAGEAIAQKFTKKQLRAAQERAAILLAEDDITDEEIAESVGVTRRQLANWKNLPEFAELVEERVKEITSGMMRLAIAKKYKRLSVLDDLHSKALQVIDERTVVENGEPGESTGLVVRQYKQVGAGKDAQLIEEFSVDVGLMREIRSLHEQAAKELGQWSEKSDVNVGGSLKREYVIVTDGDD